MGAAIVLCTVIGILAQNSAGLQKAAFGRVVVGGPMLALVVSMIACNALPKLSRDFKDGTSYCTKKFLKSAQARRTGEVTAADSVFAVAKKTFPHFILAFAAMAVLNTIGFFSEEGVKLLGKAGKYLFAAALAGVGFKIRFSEVFSKGLKPITLGGITWAAVAASSFLFAVLFSGYINK